MAITTARSTAPKDHQPDQRPSPMTPLNLLIVLIVFVIAINLTSLLVSVLMAILLGTILEGPVQRLERRSVPRAAAIALCYAAVIAAIVALVFIIVPIVQNQADDFRETFPAQMHESRDEWAVSSNPLLRGTGVSLLNSGIDFIESPEPETPTVSGDTAARAIPIVGSVLGAITSLITTLVITFYYLLEKKLVRRVVLDQLSPDNQPRVGALWTKVEDKVGGWLRGQLMLCFIIGTIATISYGILGIEFWPLLGLWAGITEIIPIVGPWLGGIPAVLVALTMGPDKAILVAIVIVAMQSLENWFLVPRVMRGAVGLTPLTVFVAILAGTQLMGVVGAILAIPIAAGLQVILTDFMDQRRAGFAIEPVQGSGWRWMLNRAREREPNNGSAPDSGDDFGTQVESDVFDEDDIDTESPEPDDDEVQFEEAPRMLVDAERYGSDSTRQSEATWPSNPWRQQASGPRESSPWRTAYRPSQPKKTTETDE